MRSTLLQKHAGQLLGRSLTLSAESLAGDGVEREFVFFGQMVDKMDLERATEYEDQIQYRILLPAKKGREISVRIRKTIRWYQNEKGWFKHEPVYHLTIKSFQKGEEGCIEAENELDPAAGEKMIEVFREQGHDGLIKRRYFFPCGRGYFPSPNEERANEMIGVRMRFPEGMRWEVDVPKEFKDLESLDRSEVEDGGCWVKLDLEVVAYDFQIKETGFDIPFPIRLKNVVYEQPGQRSDENEALVKKALAGLKAKMD